MVRRRAALVLAVAGTVVALMIGLSATASAHVKVAGIDATEGGYGVLTFRVPTESDTASTTELAVTFPDDTPIISVSTQPKPGWTVQVVKRSLPTPQKDDDGNEITQYVSQVIWKAQTPQAAIAPGSFDTFSVSAGPLPDKATLSLPAQQTYSDGTVVDWNEKAVSGQAEPEHPAPVLSLAAASGGHTSDQSMSDDSSSSPSWPGIAGLVIAITALLVGVANLALIRKGRSSN
ncbi:YcnI family protein [Gordonia sp. i37]|uniref:YcnI family copper-binding membrane protein n=1 Tax=Gordonia sp. i37 TaxID=1961707 RepID=UPI0009ACCE3D|nr:YcnI family protein [Gordonia sp. i37]OPX13928.1 hypothetical protein B1964_17775 [Gordonia sp. i37]